MTEPRRLLDDPSSLTGNERRVLAAGTKFLAPPRAKAQLWSSIAASIATAAVGPSLSSTGIAPSSVGVGSQAATGSAIAGHALSIGTTVKLALLGLGIGTSVVTASHFWFANEVSKAPQVFNTAHEPGTQGARPNVVAIQGTSTAEPVEPALSRAANDQVSAATPNPSLQPQPIESLALARSGNDMRASKPPGSSAHTRIVPESMPDRASANASEESQLVSSTRSLLRAGNTATALQLLDGAASRFHPGILIQEREALYVEALAALGRTSEASAHAEAFIRDYPKSPYASRVKSRISDVTGKTH